MVEETIEILIEKFLKGTASEDEMHQLNRWYDSLDGQKDLYQPGTVELNKALIDSFLMLRARLNLDIPPH